MSQVEWHSDKTQKLFSSILISILLVLQVAFSECFYMLLVSSVLIFDASLQRYCITAPTRKSEGALLHNGDDEREGLPLLGVEVAGPAEGELLRRPFRLFLG